ncbi:MAG TPA: hypothetical protein VH538_05885 [Gaiellaceae bacterium]
MSENRSKTTTKTRKTVATPWGAATVLDRLSIPQRAGDQRFSSLVELLENDRGERLVRIAYSTDGVVRRGPVTLRERDLERLRAELARRPDLAEAFAATVGGGA